jgi:dihydroorotate dehydrogenase electron transfer subunit
MAPGNDGRELANGCTPMSVDGPSRAFGEDSVTVNISWRIEDGVVCENTIIGVDIGRMVIEAPEVTRAARPGQFVMVRSWETEPLLPRAMAPLTYDVSSGRMEIFYKIKGPGTQAMARTHTGATAHVTGPLGQPILKRFDGRNVALIGRGVGITPLLPLAKHIVATGGTVRSYLSARTQDYLFGFDEFEALGPVHARVDDEGGRDDLVTNALAKYCREHHVDAAYVCGSQRLTRATDELGADHVFPGHVFLEEKMGCGIGYCKGCPIRLRNGGGYKLVCTEGPIFSTREVELSGPIFPPQEVGLW